MPEPRRLQLTIASIIFLLFFSPNILRSEDSDSEPFTVFCTNNKDGTGACLTTSQEPIDCILVPGSVVECNDQDKNELSCVSVHATSAIVEISCEKPNSETIQIKREESTKTTSQEDLVDGEIIESAEFEIKTDPTPVPTDQPLPKGSISSPFADPF